MSSVPPGQSLGNNLQAQVLTSNSTTSQSSLIYMGILTTGLTANITALLYILLYMESLKNLIMPLVNMATSDLLLLITGCYLRFYQELQLGDSFMCKIMNSGDIVLLHVSVFTITAMAFERFSRLKGRDLDRDNHKVAILTSLSTWIVAILISQPMWHYTVFNQSLYQCENRMPGTIRGLYYLGLFTSSYLLPGFLVTVFYTVIIYVTRVSYTRQNLHRDRQHRVTRMLAAIILLFWACHFPFWACILQPVMPDSWCPDVEYATILTYVNAASNPFMYILLRNTTFDICTSSPTADMPLTRERRMEQGVKDSKDVNDSKDDNFV